MPSNPFSRLTQTSISSDAASVNTTSSTSSMAKLLQKTKLSSFSSSSSSSSSTAKPDTKTQTDTKKKEPLSPGEKQKKRKEGRMDMETIATFGALRGEHMYYMSGASTARSRQVPASTGVSSSATAAQPNGAQSN